MTQTTSATVHKQVVVEVPHDEAFRVFTERFGDFKPPEHNLLGVPIAETVFEPRVGGRWYEVGVDGSECTWGKVLVWEPPRRLVLAWQLTAEFQYDPSFLTEVEVTFTPEGLKRTRVDFEHRDLERFGEAAARARESMGEGWQGILQLYASEAAKG